MALQKITPREFLSLQTHINSLQGRIRGVELEVGQLSRTLTDIVFPIEKESEKDGNTKSGEGGL